MNNEERDLITRFIQRVGSPPPGGTPPQAPVDREADALIADLFARYPESRYRITQTAFVQEHALAAAQNRIQQLEWDLQQARQQAQPASPPGASPWGQPPQQPESRGFLGGLFGGGSRQAPPPPQYAQPQYAPPQYAPPPPQYAPGYSPGMFQQRGSGFLGSALTTAAGVAGGMVAGNALMNLFSGSHTGAASAATTAATEFIPVTPASPWAAPSGSTQVSDPYDAGGADKGGTDNSGWTDANRGADQGQGGWQQPASDPGGWDNQQSADSGGWSDSSSDGGGGGGDDWT
jgi:hypothetical protein